MKLYEPYGSGQDEVLSQSYSTNKLQSQGWSQECLMPGLELCSHEFTLRFNRQTFIEYLCCARYCSMHWGYIVSKSCP